MTTSTMPENFEFMLDSSEPLPPEPPEGVTASMLWSVIIYLVTLLKQVKSEVVELQAELRLHQAKRFGKSSERQDTARSDAESPDETEKDEQETQEESVPASADDKAEEKGDEAAGEGGETTSSEEKKRKRGGQPGHRGTGRHIPKNIPLIIKPLELPEEERHCAQCGQAYRETGLTEDSHEVDIQVQVRVIQYQRKRYERPCDCEGSRLITAPVPPKLIPKGKFSSPSWVKFMLDKYFANVPLNRQIASLQFMGLPISQGTLIGGFKRLKAYLEPLYEHFLAHLRTASRLHADETRWRVFEEVKGKQGYRWWLWVFLSDEVIAYVLDPFRSTAAARKALSTPLSPEQAAQLSQQIGAEDNPASVIFWIDEQAYLLSPNLNTISADRYIVYTLIDERILVAFCWGHVRRDFVDFQKAYSDQAELVAWAQEWLAAIAQLYKLNDKRLAVRDQPELLATAQTKLEKDLAKMKTKSEQLESLTLKQQKIMTSLQKHWSGLILFVANPDIPMDNNVSERALRGPAGGRKTYYGHHAQWAGELAAMLFTIIQTCLLNNINPYTFLIYYFEECARLEAAPTDLNQFAPWKLKVNAPTKLLLKPP
jgi:transposase